MKKNLLPYIILPLLTTICLACSRIDNPVLGENELAIFHKQTGADLVKWPYQDIDIIIGDTLKIDIMVSSSDAVLTTWRFKGKEEIVSNSNHIMYVPACKDEFTLVYRAEKSNGIYREAEFNIHAYHNDELYSKPGVWKTKAISDKGLNGTFSAEFTVLNWGKGMNARIGLCKGMISDASNLPIDIHFEERNGRGIIECNNGGVYTFDHEIKWYYGEALRLRLDIDVADSRYSLTDVNTGVVIAENYKFKYRLLDLENWTVWSSEQNLFSKISLFDIVVKDIVQNDVPRFKNFQPLKMYGGEREKVLIEIVDPQSLSNTITATNLPRFCRFTDLGNNSAELDFAPYKENDVDAGVYDITLKTVNTKGLVSYAMFHLEVAEYYMERTVELKPTVKDGVVWDNGTINTYESSVIFNSSTNAYMAVIMNFKLPVFENPSEIDFIGAEFRTELKRKDAVHFNCDLYAIDWRNSDIIYASDFYKGEFQEKQEKTTGIMKDFLTTKSTLGVIQTSDSANDILLDFIREQYAKGGNGKYVFLRVNMGSGEYNAWQRYTLSKAEDPTTPILTLHYKFQ